MEHWSRVVCENPSPLTLRYGSRGYCTVALSIALMAGQWQHRTRSIPFNPPPSTPSTRLRRPHVPFFKTSVHLSGKNAQSTYTTVSHGLLRHTPELVRGKAMLSTRIFKNI